MRLMLLVKLPLLEIKLYLLASFTISLLGVITGYIFLMNIDSEQLVTKYLNPKNLYAVELLDSELNYNKIQYLGDTKYRGIPLDNQFSINGNIWKYEPSDFLTLQLANEQMDEYRPELKPITINRDVNISQLSIPSLGINHLAYGRYPTNTNQIALGELPAISLCSQQELSDCKKLLGQDISLSVNGSEQIFEVSGITSGGLDIYANANLQLFDRNELFSYLYSFSSVKEKKTFIANYNENFDYIDSSDYNQIGMKCKVSIIELILITTSYGFICMNELNKIKIKLKAFKQQKDWFLIYFMPCILYCISVCAIYLFNGLIL